MYEEIYNIITKELRKKSIKIVREDKALELDDLISECYLIASSENIEINTTNVDIMLNNIRKKTRKNSHSKLFEDTHYGIQQIEECTEEDIDNSMSEYFDGINLSKEEMLLILYTADKEVLKDYDFSFVRRNCSKQRGWNYSKLSKMYEGIIKKLIGYIKEDVL